MPLTKAEARSAIRQAIDDPSAKRWADPDLDVLIARTFDDLWMELLEVAPWLTSQLHLVPASQLTAPGFLDLRLTSNGGQLTQRFFRCQRVLRDQREYDELHELSQQWRIVVEQDIEKSAPQFTYQVQANQLWLHPLSLASGIELRYAFVPQAFTSLPESTQVPWVEGADSAYIWEAAARALVKGDAEDMRQMKSLAVEAFNKVKNACSRPMIGAARVQATDDAVQWGA